MARESLQRSPWLNCFNPSAESCTEFARVPLDASQAGSLRSHIDDDRAITHSSPPLAMPLNQFDWNSSFAIGEGLLLANRCHRRGALLH
jgi:hypothetical protein